MYVDLREAISKSIVLLPFVVVMLSPMLLTTVYGAVGAYWTFFELVRNRDLSRRLKVLTLGLAGSLIGAWLLAGSPRIWDLWPSHDALLDRARLNMVYYWIAALFIYVPAISYGGFLVPRLTTTVAVSVRSLIRWVFRFHAVEPTDELVKFVSTPLLLLDQEKPQALLDLEPSYLDALHEWAACRRKVVQDRLVPTTLLLAFLGLLADTSVGEWVVCRAIGVVRGFFQAQTAEESLLAYVLFALLAAVIIVPSVMIVYLLSEAFVMDYIAQACVLAKHAKSANEAPPAQGTATQLGVSRSRRLPGFLKNLPKTIVKWIRGG